METTTTNAVLTLIQDVIIVIVLYFMYRSIPAAEFAKLVKDLRADAKQTETPVDDIAVAVLERVAALISAAKPAPEPSAEPPSAPPPPDVPVDPTVG